MGMVALQPMALSLLKSKSVGHLFEQRFAVAGAGLGAGD